MTYERKYMERALELAAHGRGYTSPNPMVGAVITASDGRIIGEGYHRRCGEGHAEVNAIASVKAADRELLKQSTMYVTLEPCSHYGKTPPCAKLIIDTGIPRVVVGAADPFKEVAGRGIAMLRSAGIEVTEGVMAEESRSLNARFITAHEQQRPWVTLKWAQSADGFLDSDRPDGIPEKFSTRLTSVIVHRTRSLHDAILAGSGTVLADRPRLDCRLWPGRNPLPIIADRRRRLTDNDITTALKPLILSDYSTIKELLGNLYSRGITSLLVEGGATILNAFMEEGLWDIAVVETSPKVLRERGRVPAPELSRRAAGVFPAGPNSLSIYSNNALFSVKNL